MSKIIKTTSFKTTLFKALDKSVEQSLDSFAITMHYEEEAITGNDKVRMLDVYNSNEVYVTDQEITIDESGSAKIKVIEEQAFGDEPQVEKEKTIQFTVVTRRPLNQSDVE
jgi:hypothetical protein